MASKALITGGAGFIGFHLARELVDRGDSVVLVDSFARGVRDAELEELVAAPNVTLLTCDLRDANLLADLPGDCDYIYHLSAIIGVEHVLERPYQVLADNVKMLVHAIDLGRRQADLKRFVFASTSEVYAGTLRHFSLEMPTPETTPLAVSPLEEPRTSYMLSKIYGEALCRHSGLPITLIRPHNFYGPRMGLAHVIPQLLERAYRSDDGGDFEVYSVDHSRTFIFIDDAVQIMRRAAQSDSCVGQVLNVGNQTPEIEMGGLADIVLRTVGRKLHVVPRPATPGSPPRRCPDMSKTTEVTGFVPRVSLADGIARTFRWYVDNVFSGTGTSAR